MGGREKGLPEPRARCLLSMDLPRCPGVTALALVLDDVCCMCPCIQAMLITSPWLALRAGDEVVHSPRSLASP